MDRQKQSDRKIYPLSWKNGQMDRRTDRNNLTGKCTPVLRIDRWSIVWQESLPPLLQEWTDEQIDRQKISDRKIYPISWKNGQMDRQKISDRKIYPILKNGQMDRRTDRNNLTGKSTPVLRIDRWTDGQTEIIWQESLLLSFKNRMDRWTDRNNLTRKSTPSLERMDRWTDKQIDRQKQSDRKVYPLSWKNG